MAEVMDSPAADATDSADPIQSDGKENLAADITSGDHLTPIVAETSGDRKLSPEVSPPGESPPAALPSEESATASTGGQPTPDPSSEVPTATEASPPTMPPHEEIPHEEISSGETPNEQTPNDATPHDGADQVPAEAEIVTCELVERPELAARAQNPRSPFAPRYQIDHRQNRDGASDEKREFLSAKGGSVGALTLGILALPGAILTPASAVTAILGIGMGIWGMLSAHRTMALIGIGLCIMALMLCILRVPLGFSDWF